MDHLLSISRHNVRGDALPIGYTSHLSQHGVRRWRRDSSKADCAEVYAKAEVPLSYTRDRPLTEYVEELKEFLAENLMQESDFARTNW